MSTISETVKIYQDIRQKLRQPDLTEELRLHLVAILNKLNEQEKSLSNFKTVHEILHHLNKIDPDNSVAYQAQDSYYRKKQKEKEGFPQIHEFTGRRSAVSGAEVRLSWKVSNFDNIVLYDEKDNIISNDDHFASVFPFAAEKTERIVYRLLVTSSDGHVIDSKHEIIVFPVPVLRLISTPFPEFINDFHLQLNLSVPAFEISGALPKVFGDLQETPDTARYSNGHFLKNKFFKTLFQIIFPNEFIRTLFKRKRRSDF